MTAYWITESQRPQADLNNYTVVEATAVIATHLTELIKSHAHELLSRQAVKNLLDNLKTRLPALIEEVIPTQVKPGELQKVMQNLLRERVPVRDLETDSGNRSAITPLEPRIWKFSANTPAMPWPERFASSMWTSTIACGV